MDVLRCHSKMNSLFERFLEVKDQNEVDEHLYQLLSHLYDKDERESIHAHVIYPVFTEWLKEAVTTWSATRVNPQSNIASFILNLACFLSKKEKCFSDFNNNNFFIKLVNVSRAKQNETVSSVKLAYIKLLSTFLEHQSGIEFMIGSNFWEDAYQWSISNDSDEITSEGTRFLSKLLEQTINFDETFCNSVVKRIMLPLGENTYKSLKASTFFEVTEQVVSRHLKPTLTLVGNILEYFLEGICLHDRDFGVALAFLKNFHLEERISDFMILGQRKSLAFHLGKIMFIMQFLELYVKTMTNSITAAKINTSVCGIRTNFITSFSKGSYGDVIEFCSFGFLYWKLMEAKIPAIQVNNKSSLTPLSEQLFLLLIVPHTVAVQKYRESKKPSDEIKDEIVEMFVDKIFKKIGPDMLRIFYIWRDYLATDPTLLKMCIRTVICIRDSRKYFGKDQAVVFFQFMVNILRGFLNRMNGSSKNFTLFRNEPLLFLTIFEVLVLLPEEFEITWKDSFEAIDVIAICFEYLMFLEWPEDLVVQILKLMNIGIAKHMSPNLALLADGATDSITSLLGPLLYAKLNSTAQVKRAALDVISTMAHMSTDKFPSLQKVLMDSELPTLVVKMSTCDGESFVRATAIKCLQEMIQVEEIWNNALQTEDLPQKMRDVLLNETEGIVRVEAATFMCVAYEHQQFQKENLDRIYETMIYSSTTDLHWEVKIRALSFWDKVIKNHLQNQGMIDDSFPNVTFSKEHRKIVTLTDSEIRKRLLKVLSQLSAIGCLGVLMSAIKDDCDMEVSKTAVKITQRLVDLFRKYNVRSDSSVPTSPSPTENGMSGTVSMSSGISVDENMDSPASNNHDLNEEILEQIVNSKDVALLKNVYVASDYGSVSNYDIQVRKIVTPNEFLQFTQQDLNNIITEKKNWLNGIEDLGSLLDDMLKTYDDDVNNMDCY